MALVSGLEDIRPQFAEILLQAKREDWEKPLLFLGDLSLRIGRTLERLVRGVKVPEVLEFVTLSFPVSWLFVIVAETKRVLVFV